MTQTVFSQDVIVQGAPSKLFLTGHITTKTGHAHIDANQPLPHPDGDAADRRYRVTVTVEEVGE